MKTTAHSNGNPRKQLRTILMLLVAFSGCATPERQQPGSQTNLSTIPQALSHLEEEWRGGHIQEVVVLHVPSDNVYRIEFTPEALDRDYSFEMVVRGPDMVAVTKELMAKVQKIAARPSTKEASLRWAFIFLTSKERVLSVYVDKTGYRGVINGHNVDFESNELFTWAESTFESIFR